jgi:hypothetical protein
MTMSKPRKTLWAGIPISSRYVRFLTAACRLTDSFRQGAYHEGRPRPVTDSFPTLPSGRPKEERVENEIAIPPTQRISQVRLVDAESEFHR